MEALAWAAFRAAWGGQALGPACNGSHNSSFRVLPRDSRAPLVLFAGDAERFGNRDNFTRAVLAAPLRVDAADVGTALTVETNLGPKAATVVEKPFYDPKKSLATG